MTEEKQSFAESAIDALQRIASLERYRETPVVGVRLMHYTAGLKFDLPVVSSARWRLLADLGVGATRLSTSDLSKFETREYRFSEIYPSFRGLLTLEYAVSDACRLFFAGQQFLYLDDGSVGIKGFRQLELTDAAGLWTFPLIFGARVRVN